jgi:hypothetical protein
VHQVGEGVGAVVAAVADLEFAFLCGESEAAGQGQTVVGEVEPVPVGEDVAEVGVEVDELLFAEETGDGLQAESASGVRSWAESQSWRVCGRYSRNRVRLADAVRRASMRFLMPGEPPQ